MSPLIECRREGGTWILTLNRPEKRNALSLDLVRALHDAVDGLHGEADLRAVVITGAGNDFVAGADIAELRERRVAEALASINGALFRRIEELPVPVIAALRGYVLGGGCELALACDIRVAGESTVLGQPEVGLGILPGAGATYRLPRVVGMGRARELIFTGRRVGAQEAVAMGLVNRVVEDEEVLPAALEMAEAIGRQGALAVRLAKLALNAQAPAETGSAVERLAQGILFETEDKERRMDRFLEGRGGSDSGRSRAGESEN